MGHAWAKKRVDDNFVIENDKWHIRLIALYPCVLFGGDDKFYLSSITDVEKNADTFINGWFHIFFRFHLK